jgi:hypothetical protein
VVRIAEALRRLVTREPDYHRFAAQGGHWGSAIIFRQGHAYPDKLIGIHLNLLFIFPGPQQGEMTQEECR